MTITLDVPIACELTGEALVARRQDIVSHLLSKMEGQQELADGYAFRFPNEDEIAQKLWDFILVERKCCSFFQIELVFEPNNGPIWLYLRGGDGVKRFAEMELGSFISQRNKLRGSG